MSMHADGIGLWRTEVGMLARTSAPDENQLTAIFNRAARYSRNKPILIRTIDFTGDKLTDFYENLNLDQYKKEQAKLQKEQGVHYNKAAYEDGKKHIISEQNKIIRTQMRAALRAKRDNPEANIKIMIPVVHKKEHLDWMQKMMVAEANKIGLDPIEVGCMIETKEIVEHLQDPGFNPDFMSIGSNDLTCELLDIDRYDDEDMKRYDPTHPDVLGKIKHTIIIAKKRNIPVSICGDMASDPRYFALLHGLGIRNFSGSAQLIGVMKEMHERLGNNKNAAIAIARKVIQEPDTEKRQKIINNFNLKYLGLKPDWSITDFVNEAELNHPTA